MAAHDAQHGRQAQAPAGEFGGKKRFEDAPLGFLVHAGARIRDLEPDVQTFGQVFVEIRLAKIFARTLHQAGRDRDDAAAVADGFRGVGHQVHDDLADLAGIAVQRRQRFLQIQVERGFLRNGGLQQGEHVSDQIAQPDVVDDETALAGISQNLATEFRGAQRGFLDRQQAFARRRQWR